VNAKRRKPRPGEHVHLIVCLADHYEPAMAKAIDAFVAAHGGKLGLVSAG